MEIKKILIGCPTSSSKSYCDFEWIDNTLKLMYPNFKVVVFDNTDDNGDYCNRLNNYYKNKYGNGNQFECIKSDTTNCVGLISKINKSHNDFREYAIENKYDYALHLESDVFPPINTLLELLLHKKQVVGAMYYRDEGRFRKLMVQQRITRAPNNITMHNFDQQDDLYFVDGTLKQAGHIGLGCVLISADVLKKIPFRYIPGMEMHSDSFWADDVHRAGIKIWVDTALVCRHDNQNWITEVGRK